MERFPIDLWHLDRQWFLRRTGVLEGQARPVCPALLGRMPMAADGGGRLDVGSLDNCKRLINTVGKLRRDSFRPRSRSLFFFWEGGITALRVDKWCMVFDGLMVGWIGWMDGYGSRTEDSYWLVVTHGWEGCDGGDWVGFWLSLWHKDMASRLGVTAHTYAFNYFC